MMDINVTSDDLALLTKWDTPTICNALEEIIPERRGYGFTTTHLFSLDPALPYFPSSLFPTSHNLEVGSWKLVLLL